MGRDPALAAVGAALEAALTGSGRLFLVSGDAGIGKTALARAMSEEARRRKTLVLWAACSPGGGTPAYWPWTQLLRDIGAVTDVPEETHRLIAQVTPRPREERALPRLELYDAVYSALSEVTRSRPVVAVIDDLHWADLPSLDLLDTVARRLAGRPMLLLGTYRDLEAPAELHRLAAGVDGITLGGLDVDAVTELVTAITGSAPAPVRAEDLRGRTGGNPLFVRELARLLVARGTGVATSAGLPETVAETLLHRLDQLGAQCRALLTVAAVADSTQPELLHRVTGLQGDQLIDLLEEGVMARVLAERQAGVSSRPFVHDLFREALLAATDRDELRRLHASVAEALIGQRAAGTSVPAGRIAEHLRHALDGRPDATAVEWSVCAAEEATVRLGHEEAVRQYRHAVTIAGEPAEPGLLLALAESQLRAGDAGAGASFLLAADAARRSGDRSLLAAAALGLHRVGARGDHDLQLELLEEAIAAEPEPTADRARLLAALARERKHAWLAPDDCRRPAEDAVRAARELAEPVVLADCLLALHDAVWAPGTAALRLGIVDEMAEAAVAADDSELIAQAQVLRAGCLIELNDPEGLVELADYCRRAESLGHARGRWEALSRRVTLGLVTGALEEALDAARLAHEEGRRIGIPDADGVHGTQSWTLALFTRDRMALVDGMQGIDGVPHIDRFVAAAMRSEGDPEEARRLAVTLPPDRDEKYDLEFVALAADALAAAGPTESARACYADLLPFAGTNVLVGGCASFWGPVDLYLGELAAGLGDRTAAQQHLADAEAMSVHLGAPLWAAHAARRRSELTPGRDAVRFARQGDVWRVAWNGSDAHVPDSKGVQDLALLVANPGSEVSATELTGRRPLSGADPVLDDEAKAAFRRRLSELDAEIEEAESNHDPARMERAVDEREALVAELSSAVGLGGRDRRLGDDAERARKAVTARIRDAIRRVESVHPALGDHLAATVRTGTWCSYRPTAASDESDPLGPRSPRAFRSP